MNHLSRRAATAAVATALAAAGTVVALHGSDAAQAVPSPGQFAKPGANPWFPLVPGTVVRYRGTDDGERLREKVVVTHRTKRIQGVETRVVLDVLRRRDGSLAERTHDWYAVTHDDDVWYFGERTATYDDQGRLESREGSWQAGVDGASAGLIMPAHPRATDAYRQEYYRRHAEDQAWIVQQHFTARTPGHRFPDAVRSLEWSRLEGGVVSQKVYGRGVGIVTEHDMSGGTERFWVVSVARPGA